MTRSAAARCLAACLLLACGGREVSSGTADGGPSTASTATPTGSDSSSTGGDEGTGTTATGTAAAGATCASFCTTDFDCRGCAASGRAAVLCCDPVSQQCYESVQATCNLGSTSSSSSGGPGITSSSSGGGPGTTSSSSSGGPGDPDAATTDHCAGAVHVPLGGTVSGTTCAGATHVGETPCQSPGNPDVFIYVDAPDGTALTLTASPGVSIMAFATCESAMSLQCTFAQATFEPTDTRERLFAVERADTQCGPYTFGAATR
jgi:hypothetical protein